MGRLIRRVALLLFLGTTVVGTAWSAEPNISSLSPASGPIGTAVTVSGSNFGATQGTSTIKFNGVAGTPTSWSNTVIVVPVPTGSTTGPVVVTVGGFVSNGITFTVTPLITSISPTSGMVGTVGTVSGSNFGATQGTSTIKFNGTTVTPSSWSNASIVVSIPPGIWTSPGDLLVEVVVSNFVSNSVTFTLTPGIAGVTPASGSVGTPVAISGSLFGLTQGTSTVALGGVTVTPTSWGATTILVQVPSAATAGPIVVTVNGLASNLFPFTVSPGITSLSPAAGPVGTSVTINGSSFGATQGSSTVTFNSVPAAPTAWGNTSIVVPVPAGTTTGPVLVTVNGVSSNALTFTVPPTISSLSPSSRPAGTSVTVKGANFGSVQGASKIQFNGVEAATTSWSPNSIVTVVPASATTGPVVVTVGDMTSNGVTFTVGTGTIAGIVSRVSDGNPVGGAFIEAIQSNVVLGSATTAGDGSYSIGNLAPGTYHIRASASGLGTVVLTGIAVAAGSTTTANLALPSPGIVAGKVTKSDGVTPIASATITLFQGSVTTGAATTDAAGDYTISGVSPGTYNVRGSAPGYNTQTQTGVAVVSGATTTINLSLSSQPVITYVYDELGRLVGAVDSLSDAAVYSYDAVGNLVSISRNSAAQVSIIRFAPESGPVGTTVTIDGTGFSTNTGQNTVNFNGVPAVVTSATNTRIVTSVPVGATNGSIAVTSPAGSATSSTPFTVTTGGAVGAPTISGFSPTIGKAGDPVTVNGNNFETSLVNDRVSFNGTLASPVSATATSISTSVPPTATSGHISVSTPAGKAVSIDDFFIVPGSYAVANVAVTDRMTFGVSKTITISVTNKIALLLFDGTAGQSVSLLLSSVSIPASDITVYGPGGGAVVLTFTVSSSGGLVIDQATLFTSGTNTILVAPRPGYTGSMTLTVYDSPDVIGTIVPGGPSVTVNTTSPGQNARLTFNGTVNQHVSVSLSSGTYNSSCSLTIKKPDGTSLISSGCGGATSFLDVPLLPVAGTYTLFINPQGTNTGSVIVTLNDVTDVTGTIPADGTATAVTITTPGQNARLTFSGTAGGRISLQAINITIPSGTVSVLKPDGTTLSSLSIFAGQSPFMDVQTLPVAGAYTVFVDPSSANTGNVTLRLYTVPADVTGTITAGGVPITVSTTVPGQNAQLTFSGTVNQHVSVSVSGGSYSSCLLTVKKPDGNALGATGGCSGATSFLDVPLLPVAGTYTLLVDPQGTSTGGATVTLNDATDVTGTITADGTATSVTTTTPGQNARLTFSGTSGQRVSLQATNITVLAGTVSVLKPDGTTLSSTSFSSGGSFFIDVQTLPVTGTYTVFVDPSSTNTGSVTLRLYTVPADVTGTITIGGTAVTVTITVPGQNAQLTFSGTANQQVSLHGANNSIGTTTFKILRPDGTTLQTTSSSSSTFNFSTVTLPTTGTYTVVVDPFGANAGSVNLTLTSP